MTNDAGKLHSFKPYHGPDKIVIGDGKTLKITHIGDTSIFTPYGQLRLKNVLLVPNITKNLLSIGKLADDLSCVILI